jgi:hypothetical protein
MGEADRARAGEGGRIVGMGAWGVAVGHTRRSVGEGGLPCGGSATAGGGGGWSGRAGWVKGRGRGCCRWGKRKVAARTGNR